MNRIPHALISPLAIAVVGVLVSIALWQAMQRRQDAEIERNAETVATLLATVIQARIEEHELAALRRWVESWTPQDSTDSRAWRATAERFLTEHPAYAGLVRVVRGKPGDVVGSPDASAPILAFIERIERDRDVGPPSDALLGPIRLSDGRAALGVGIPFGRAASDAVLFALLEPEVAVSRILEQVATGYSIRVVCGSEDLIDTPKGGELPALDRFWRSQSIALSTGASLTVGVHPTAMLTSSLGSDGPRVGLSAGLAIATLAAGLTHVHQRARRRAQPFDTEAAGRTALLNETIEELEAMNSSVSHDLRSAMGAVINFTEILREDYGHALDDPARDYLRRISSSANLAVALMEGLLEFARTGREELHKTQVDMRRLVERVRDDLIGTDPSVRSRIEIADLPFAWADPEMIRRVVVNLISNALKFVNVGELPRIRIGAERNAEEVVYFVSDQGIGFDMRQRDKLFHVFERLHASGFAGHGVGLAIVARIVGRHGGRVWALGSEGKGSTFLFSLPLAGPEAEP